MNPQPSGNGSDKSDTTDPEQEAARRILDTVARWREMRRQDGMMIRVSLGRNPGVNLGPRLAAADLGTVASMGAVGAAMMGRLRSWGATNHAKDAGPDDALVFLQSLADRGVAEALKRGRRL